MARRAYLSLSVNWLDTRAECVSKQDALGGLHEKLEAHNDGARQVSCAGPEAGSFRELSIGFDQALRELPEALKKEGFGIITEIDLQQTFKAKLGVDFRRYRVLGACNPGFALEAVQQDPRVGVLLPCNVVLYEKDDGTAVVGAIDPMQTIGARAGGEALAGLADEVGTRLQRALSSLSDR